MDFQEIPSGGASTRIPDRGTPESVYIWSSLQLPSLCRPSSFSIFQHAAQYGGQVHHFLTAAWLLILTPVRFHAVTISDADGKAPIASGFMTQSYDCCQMAVWTSDGGLECLLLRVTRKMWTSDSNC